MKCPNCNYNITTITSSQKQWRQRKAALGLCQRCGQVPSVNGTTSCKECGIKHAEHMIQRRK